MSPLSIIWMHFCSAYAHWSRSKAIYVSIPFQRCTTNIDRGEIWKDKNKYYKIFIYFLCEKNRIKFFSVRWSDHNVIIVCVFCYAHTWVEYLLYAKSTNYTKHRIYIIIHLWKGFVMSASRYIIFFFFFFWWSCMIIKNHDLFSVVCVWEMSVGSSLHIIFT